jgi:pimeloyl-ACP methyl ester carboxylesterase
MASVFSALQHGFAERLGEVRVPVEIVLGNRSPLPNERGASAAAFLPRGRATVVARAGHLLWHEVPGCVHDALDRVAPTCV